MKKLILSALLLASSTSLQANFIEFTSNVKVVFTTVTVVNSNGDTVTATQATASVIETDPAKGQIIAKRQTYVQVPDGNGGQETIVTQEETVATVKPSGAFDVETTTQKLTTPVDVNGNPIGATLTEEEPVFNLNDVDEADLDLPPTTTFVPADPQLDIPVVISAE